MPQLSAGDNTRAGHNPADRRAIGGSVALCLGVTSLAVPGTVPGYTTMNHNLADVVAGLHRPRARNSCGVPAPSAASKLRGGMRQTMHQRYSRCHDYTHASGPF
jgi:hypothetical protein